MQNVMLEHCLNYLVIGCLGVTFGMLIDAIINFGMGDGNPSYNSYFRTRVPHIMFSHLFWMLISIYVYINVIENLSLINILITGAVYLISVLSGKLINFIFENRGMQWYFTMCFYLIYFIYFGIILFVFVLIPYV